MVEAKLEPETASDLQAVAKMAAERAGKNASVAPELLYAPILWTLQDAAAARDASAANRLCAALRSHGCSDSWGGPISLTKCSEIVASVFTDHREARS